MSDGWNQQFHMDFRRLWIGPMHTISRLLNICMQLPSVPVKTTAVLCVLSWSEKVTDNRSGCYRYRHLSNKWEYCDKENTWLWKIWFHTKRKYSPENTEVYLGLLSQNQTLKEKKLDLRADQDFCRYNIQFFGFNTNRSAKAYYFRLNYDQWATVGFRLFKTKAPSFLPTGLQRGKKKSKPSKVKQNGDIRREGEQTSIVLHLFSMIKT